MTLRHTPPPLRQPRRVTRVPDNGGAIDGGGGDLVVAIPTVVSRALTIRAARHVHVLGLDLRFPSGPPGRQHGAGALTFVDIAGTAFVEGCRIDVANHYADAIRIHTSPGATLVVQNCRLVRTGGVPAGPHGDLIHAQGKGPLECLAIEGLHGLTSYQGIFCPFQRPSAGARRVEIADAVLGWHPDRPAGQKDLTLLYLGRAGDKRDPLPPDGVVLDNVWLDLAGRHHPGSTLRTRVIPRPTADGGFGGATNIDGRVRDATGRGLCLVPADRVGLAYDRRWFAGDEPDLPDEPDEPCEDEPDEPDGPCDEDEPDEPCDDEPDDDGEALAAADAALAAALEAIAAEMAGRMARAILAWRRRAGRAEAGGR